MGTVSEIRPGSGLPGIGSIGSRPRSAVQPPTRPAGADFGQVLAQKLSSHEVRFSAHAQARLRAAGIELGPEEQLKLREAVNKAAAKGARESLVLMGDVALVVSVKHRTVITAVEAARMRDNVFTNIDSAVIT